LRPRYFALAFGVALWMIGLAAVAPALLDHDREFRLPRWASNAHGLGSMVAALTVGLLVVALSTVFGLVDSYGNVVWLASLLGVVGLLTLHARFSRVPAPATIRRHRR
jgi:hypothetical protein